MSKPLPLLASLAQCSLFDPVEYPHQHAGSLHRLGGFADVVVIDLAVARRVAEDGICAREERARALLLALLCRRVRQWTLRPESLVHQRDSDDLITETRELSHSDLDRLHRCEDSLLELAQ